MTLRPYSADLQQQFRTTLGTPGAPEIFDDSVPVQAVAVVASTPQAVNVTTTATKNTATVIAATRTISAGTTTIGTVGAGRVWRIIGLALTGMVEVGTVNSGTRIELNAVSALALEMGSITGASGQKGMGATSISFDYACCPVLTAGQTVTLITDTADIVDARATVYYVDEAA